MTLVECLVALVISGIVMAALTHMLEVAHASYRAGADMHRQYAEASIVMQRLANAIELAQRKKKQDLTTKTTSSSGDWLNKYDPVKNQTTVVRYDWDSSNKSLRETEGGNLPVSLLSNVTDFKVEALDGSSATALISISLTVGAGPDTVTVREIRRLGGAW